MIFTRMELALEDTMLMVATKRDWELLEFRPPSM